MTIVSFLVGFRLHGGIANGVLAFALVVLFSFVFVWVFMATGLYAENAQAAQGLALILVPFTFVVGRAPAGVRLDRGRPLPAWLRPFQGMPEALSAASPSSPGRS